MAYRGGAAPWILATVMFIFAAVFAGLYFSQTTETQKFLNSLKQDKIQVISNEYGNEDAKNRLMEIGKLKAIIAGGPHAGVDYEGKDPKIDALKDQIVALKERRDDLVAAVQDKEGNIENRDADIQGKENYIRNLEQQNRDIVSARNEKLNSQLQELTSQNDDWKERNGELTDKVSRLEEKNETTAQGALKQIINLQRQQRKLTQVIVNWQKQAGRREKFQAELYDGKIITADVLNKFVVVDLGRTHKVHRGLRFNVIRWRLNRWDYMATIEIKKVGQTTSTAIILDAIVPRKVCPVTGYIANDPEERYSPYVASGENNNQVVELVRVGTDVRPTMRRFDPIVVGDYITNPFYSRKRQLKFVVAGDPIEYSPTELKQQITKYGGIIQETVDVDTDYLVLGRIQRESAALDAEPEARKRRDFAQRMLKTAELYNIPVMREVELFNFLRQ